MRITAEWQAALLYLLILVMVVNVHFIVIADIRLYGIHISLYRLLVYSLYSMDLVGSGRGFIRQYLLASAGTFFVFYSSAASIAA